MSNLGNSQLVNLIPYSTYLSIKRYRESKIINAVEMSLRTMTGDDAMYKMT